MKRGFTMIELLVTMGILSVLFLVVLIAINPVELQKQARDSRRVADLAALNAAISLYSKDNSFTSFGSPTTTYLTLTTAVKIANCGSFYGLPGTDPANPSSTGGYSCPTTASATLVNGAGWLPLNLNAMAGGSPLSVFPLDPTNTSSSNAFYAYNTDNNTCWEVTAPLESNKYQTTPPPENSLAPFFPHVIATGPCRSASALYSTGNYFLFWPITEGNGSTTGDASGNGNVGTFSGGPSWITSTMPAWSNSASCVGAACLNTCQSDYVSGGSGNGLNFTNATFTVAYWFNPHFFGAGSIPTVYVQQGSTTIDLETSTSPGGTYASGFAGVTLDGGASGTAHILAQDNFTNQQTWHFLVVEAIPGNPWKANFYMDGTFDSQTTTPAGAWSGTPTAAAYGISVGAIGNNNCGRIINSVRVYKRLLSPAEIWGIYLNEKPSS